MKTFKLYNLAEKAMVNHGVTIDVSKKGNAMVGTWSNENEKNTILDIARAIVLLLNNDGYKIKNRVIVLDKKGNEIDSEENASSSGKFTAS